MATTIDLEFEEIDDARDHCEWLAEQLEAGGGELVVRYHRLPAEERRRREEERRLEIKRAQLKRLKEELGET